MHNKEIKCYTMKNHTDIQTNTQINTLRCRIKSQWAEKKCLFAITHTLRQEWFSGCSLKKKLVTKLYHMIHTLSFSMNSFSSSVLLSPSNWLYFVLNCFFHISEIYKKEFKWNLFIDLLNRITFGQALSFCFVNSLSTFCKIILSWWSK